VALFTIQNEFRYDIVRKIFEGGMGIVYEAEQLGARKFVKRIAIKVIRQNYATQKQFIENFIGEARLVADLIHTNIVQTTISAKPTASTSSPWSSSAARTLSNSNIS